MAACSYHWPFGTRFRIQGDTAHAWVECQDRGGAVGNRNHLDVFFYTAAEGWAWLAQVGDWAEVEVLP
jgi:3D (Asp-Asp-Asp) domain-containing protein